MSLAAQYWWGAFAVAKRDFLIFASYRTMFVSSLMQSLFAVILFYYLSRLVNIGGFASPDEYYAYVLVGLAALRVLTSTLIQLPSTIRQELVAGTFERVLVSPLGPVAGILGMMVFPFLFALVVGLWMLVVAAVVFGLPLQWSTMPLAVPAGLLVGFAFAPFAVLLAAAVVTVKQTSGGAGAFLALFSIVGGFYFPITLLPDWIQWTADVQPFTPALELLRHLLIGAPLTEPALLLIVKLLGFSVIGAVVSVWALRRAIESSQRRGTIIEY